MSERKELARVSHAELLDAVAPVGGQYDGHWYSQDGEQRKDLKFWGFKLASHVYECLSIPAVTRHLPRRSDSVLGIDNPWIRL